MEATSIAGLVQECLDNFKQDLSLLVDATDRGYRDRLKDEQGRFRIWVGNVSARTSGRRSLEYRLRDASDLAATTTKFLRELLSILQTGTPFCFCGSQEEPSKARLGAIVNAPDGIQVQGIHFIHTCHNRLSQTYLGAQPEAVLTLS